MRRACTVAALALVVMVPPEIGAVAATFGTDDIGPRLTIVIEFVVEDAVGKAIGDLKLAELEVVQDAERQQVASFKTLAAPGRYELTYAPHSGKAGGVTVRVLRRGSRVKGPEGDVLKPRILRPPSPLEAELERVLESHAEARDLRCRVTILHFEPRADGMHQTIAVEVPSSEVHFRDDHGEMRGHLQILVRLKDENDRVVQRITLDRLLEPAGGVRLGTSDFETLVWTGHIHLPAGAYRAETLVFEPESGRATTERIPFQAVPPPGTLLSSVILLQPREFMNLAEPTPDDPLVVAGEPVMPTLDLAIAAGASAQVRFFVTVYPDPKNPEPPTLLLELRRGDEGVGSVPLKLPPPASSGEIRYVGLMPTRSFRPAAYVLRVVARQGSTAASEETAFTVAPVAAPAP